MEKDPSRKRTVIVRQSNSLMVERSITASSFEKSIPTEATDTADVKHASNIGHPSIPSSTKKNFCNSIDLSEIQRLPKTCRNNFQNDPRVDGHSKVAPNPIRKTIFDFLPLSTNFKIKEEPVDTNDESSCSSNDRTDSISPNAVGDIVSSARNKTSAVNNPSDIQNTQTKQIKDEPMSPDHSGICPAVDNGKTDAETSSNRSRGVHSIPHPLPLLINIKTEALEDRDNMSNEPPKKKQVVIPNNSDIPQKNELQISLTEKNLTNQQALIPETTTDVIDNFFNTVHKQHNSSFENPSQSVDESIIPHIRIKQEAPDDDENNNDVGKTVTDKKRSVKENSLDTDNIQQLKKKIKTEPISPEQPQMSPEIVNDSVPNGQLNEKQRKTQASINTENLSIHEALLTEARTVTEETATCNAGNRQQNSSLENSSGTVNQPSLPALCIKQEPLDDYENNMQKMHDNVCHASTKSTKPVEEDSSAASDSVLKNKESKSKPHSARIKGSLIPASSKNLSSHQTLVTTTVAEANASGIAENRQQSSSLEILSGTVNQPSFPALCIKQEPQDDNENDTQKIHNVLVTAADNTKPVEGNSSRGNDSIQHINKIKIEPHSVSEGIEGLQIFVSNNNLGSYETLITGTAVEEKSSGNVDNRQHLPENSQQGINQPVSTDVCGKQVPLHNYEKNNVHNIHNDVPPTTVDYKKSVEKNSSGTIGDMQHITKKATTEPQYTDRSITSTATGSDETSSKEKNTYVLINPSQKSCATSIRSISTESGTVHDSVNMTKRPTCDHNIAGNAMQIVNNPPTGTNWTSSLRHPLQTRSTSNEEIPNQSSVVPIPCLSAKLTSASKSEALHAVLTTEKPFSASSLNYFHLKDKIDRSDVEECLRYMEEKYPRTKAFSLFFRNIPSLAIADEQIKPALAQSLPVNISTTELLKIITHVESNVPPNINLKHSLTDNEKTGLEMKAAIENDAKGTLDSMQQPCKFAPENVSVGLESLRVRIEASRFQCNGDNMRVQHDTGKQRVEARRKKNEKTAHMQSERNIGGADTKFKKKNPSAIYNIFANAFCFLADKVGSSLVTTTASTNTGRKQSFPDSEDGNRKKSKITPEDCAQRVSTSVSRDPRMLKSKIFNPTLHSSIYPGESLSKKESFIHPPAVPPVEGEELLHSSTRKSAENIHIRYPVDAQPRGSRAFSIVNESKETTNNPKEAGVSLHPDATHGPSKSTLKVLCRDAFESRKGKQVSLSKCPYKEVGKNFVNKNDFASLILEWNANWLRTQEEKLMCPPICDSYVRVKYTYESELEYYNTYSPLHMLSIWLKVSDSWKKSTTYYNCVYDTLEHKTNAVKIVYSTTLNALDVSNWPTGEDMLLVTAAKPNRNAGEMLALCRCLNALHKDYDPPRSSHHGQPGVWKKVKIDSMCAEALSIQLHEPVRVQRLCNLRVSLLQNDALQSLNSAMKRVVLDPRNHAFRIRTVRLLAPHNTDLFQKSISSIVDSAVSPETLVTLVDTSPPCDSVLAISHIAFRLMKKNSAVLIFAKVESFLKLAERLKDYNLVLAVRARDFKLTDDIEKCLLSKRLSTEKNGEFLRKGHITLSVLSAIYLANMKDTLSEQKPTCIIDDAHLYTEAETALPFYYNARNLILMGRNERQTDVHPILKRFNYDMSLFNRLCKSKEEVAGV